MVLIQPSAFMTSSELRMVMMIRNIFRASPAVSPAQDLNIVVKGTASRQIGLPEDAEPAGPDIEELGQDDRRLGRPSRSGRPWP